MKRINFFALSLMVGLTCLMPMTACKSDPVDEACDTVEVMESQKDKTQDALDDFHQDADDKEAEADAILDMVE